MKKSILATMTVAAALVASSPLAKANAFLEVVSGALNSTTVVTGSDSGTLSASIGGWTISTETGISSVFGITLTSSSTGPATAGPLTVYYSSGAYAQTGLWVLGASTTSTAEQALHGIPIGVTPPTIDYSAAVYSNPLGTGATTGVGNALNRGTYGGGTLGGQLGLTDLLGPNANAPQQFGLLLGALGNFTEILTINPILVPAHTVQMNAEIQTSFSIIPITVPDGGLTIALLGSVLIGLAGIRCKFGNRS